MTTKPHNHPTAPPPRRRGRPRRTPACSAPHQPDLARTATLRGSCPAPPRSTGDSSSKGVKGAGDAWQPARKKDLGRPSDQNPSLLRLTKPGRRARGGPAAFVARRAAGAPTGRRVSPGGLPEGPGGAGFLRRSGRLCRPRFFGHARAATPRNPDLHCRPLPGRSNPNQPGNPDNRKNPPKPQNHMTFKGSSRGVPGGSAPRPTSRGSQGAPNQGANTQSRSRGPRWT